MRKLTCNSAPKKICICVTTEPIWGQFGGQSSGWSFGMSYNWKVYSFSFWDEEKLTWNKCKHIEKWKIFSLEIVFWKFITFSCVIGLLEEHFEPHSCSKVMTERVQDNFFQKKSNSFWLKKSSTWKHWVKNERNVQRSWKNCAFDCEAIWGTVWETVSLLKMQKMWNENVTWTST
jgi:hypothetical protein